MPVDPIYYVEAFLSRNPAVRDQLRAHLLSHGITLSNDLRAWKIVEEEFLVPYRDRIYPKKTRAEFESSGGMFPVNISRVVALIIGEA